MCICVLLGWWLANPIVISYCAVAENNYYSGAGSLLIRVLV